MSKVPSGPQEAPFLKRWHRRMGLSAATFVIILASTGLSLNHTVDWRLDSRSITSRALLNWYGISQPESFLSYPLGETHVTQVGDEIFLEAQEIAHCSGRLRGAIMLSMQGFIVIACDHEIFVLTQTYDLLERLGAAHGIPSPIEKIGRRSTGQSETSLILLADKRYFVADLDSLTWTPLDDTDLVDSQGNKSESGIVLTWSNPVTTPPELSSVLAKHFIGEGITVEKLLLDIHSGRIAGRWGILIVDIMAIVFVLLSLTGFMMWLREASKTRSSGDQ